MSIHGLGMCKHCGTSIHNDGGAWVDRSGGDGCLQESPQNDVHEPVSSEDAGGDIGHLVEDIDTLGRQFRTAFDERGIADQSFRGE